MQKVPTLMFVAHNLFPVRVVPMLPSVNRQREAPLIPINPRRAHESLLPPSFPTLNVQVECWTHQLFHHTMLTPHLDGDQCLVVVVVLLDASKHDLDGVFLLLLQVRQQLQSDSHVVTNALNTHVSSGLQLACIISTLIAFLQSHCLSLTGLMPF